MKEAGWEVNANDNGEDEMNDIDIHAIIEEADQERRSSEDLVTVPRRVRG